MSIFNSEQSRLNACKESLKYKSNEELREIAQRTTKTSLLFSNGKAKTLQLAAFQLLKEWRNNLQ